MEPASAEQDTGVLERDRARLRQLLRQRMGSVGDWYPLSHGQEALWFLWRLAPDSWAYNIVFPVGLRGELSVASLQRSLQKLADRHACLRTEFRDENGHILQRARPHHALQLEQLDASAWSRAQLDDALRQRARCPFDLETDSALRVSLFRRAPDNHVLLLVVPHIVSDLWSWVVLMDELREVYRAEKAGVAFDLPLLAVSYEDYVRWQRGMLETEAGAQHWHYWRDELAGELPVLDLPTDRHRPAARSFGGDTVTRQFNADLIRAIKQLAGAENATLFMTLLAAYQVLLHRYSGQQSIVVGSAVAGRRSEFNGLFGDFVNMAPLRADLSGDLSFRDVLAQCRVKVTGAVKHQDFPFSLIVDRLRPARDLSRTPIFQASFIFQRFHRFEALSGTVMPAPDEPMIAFADLMMEPWPLAQQEGQYDLTLEMKEDARGRLMSQWKYSTDLFATETIERIAGQFETLLGAIVAAPERRIGELPLLSPEQASGAVAAGRGTPVPLPEAISVSELVEQQVIKNAATIAIGCGDESVTYAELGGRVERLARALANSGVKPEALVAVWLPRGIDFIVALLAIGKAGGAFLPLDLRHPLPRLLQVIENSAAPFVLTSRALAENVTEAVAGLGVPPRVLAVEDAAAAADTRRLPRVGASNLAYVMYTSGSTGSPKGVMVEHRGMVNHLLAKLSDLGIGPNDVVAQNAPQSFDVIVWQCLAALAVGGRVAVISDDVAENSTSLIAAMQSERVTILQLVPSMLHALVAEAASLSDGPPALPALRWVVPTGDALPAPLCRQWFDLYPDIPVLNTYGSTECSDDQCHYALDRLGPADTAEAIVSIGTPIRNMSAHVLDRNLAPVPVGVVGELYIGGIGVGRGYRGDAARTAASFVPDPFAAQPGDRLYKTRDLARRRADGTIAFLGRVDQMIKLRGLRIEPGEIEAVLRDHPAVSDAAVLARDHPSGERRLVGYVVPAKAIAANGSGATPHLEELRRFLADRLPLYMVPTTFRLLDAMPLNANGKLDPHMLPAPEWQSVASERYDPPRTSTEQQLAAIWAETLRIERVGINDDFFAIGGDSILSIQIVARCRRSGLVLQAKDLFQHRTIAELAALLQDQEPHPQDAAAAESVVPPLQPIDPVHLKLAISMVRFDEA